MKVPLMAYSEPNGISLVYNKKKIEIGYPVEPAVYVKKGSMLLSNPDEKSYDLYTDVFSKEKIYIGKEIFNTAEDAGKFFHTNKKSEEISGLNYLEQIYVEHPEFFTQYENKIPLSKLTFDIETYNEGDGIFPKASTHPIIAIAYKINNQPTEVLMNYNDVDTDKLIVDEFLEVIRNVDPDLIVGYNCIGMTGEGFDIPYIIKRAQHHKLNLGRISRWNWIPIRKNEYDEEEYHIYGRVVFDVFNFVMKDQSLMGIKNRKLETLAQWYKIPYFKHDAVYTQHSKYVIGTDDLKKHVASDVDVTYKLFEIYFPLQKTLAELLNIPLGNIVNSYASFVPKIYQARNFFRHKYIAFQSNKERYGANKMVFQGAFAGLNKPGVHKDVYGVDAASFYPSIIRTFNLSPECTKIIKREPYKEINQFHNDGEKLYIQFPDDNLKELITMRIDLTKQGFLTHDAETIFEMRNKLKKQIEKADPSMKSILKSKSDAMKVINNSMYGQQGQPSTWYGDLSVGMAITALARWLISEAMNFYSKDDVIAYDTDGIYVSCEPRLEELIKYINKIIKDKTKMESKITFELKGHYSGYFHMTKNYILKDDKGHMVRHGVAMKSSKLPKMYDEVIAIMSEEILKGSTMNMLLELSKALYTLNKFEFSDFVMRTRINKNIPDNFENAGEDDYSNPEALQPALVERAKTIYGKELKKGDSIEYVKTMGGYKLKEEVSTIKELDIPYYKSVVNSALRIFRFDINSVNENMQGELDLWGEGPKFIETLDEWFNWSNKGGKYDTDRSEKATVNKRVLKRGRRKSVGAI